MNYQKWSVEVGNSTLSEAVQRLAFSFGYEWNDLRKNVGYTNGKFLIFYPETKEIKFGIDETNSKIVVKTFEEMVKLFKNPPKADLNYGSDITIHVNGEVTVGNVTLEKSTFEALVEVRRKYLDQSK